MKWYSYPEVKPKIGEWVTIERKKVFLDPQRAGKYNPISNFVSIKYGSKVSRYELADAKRWCRSLEVVEMLRMGADDLTPVVTPDPSPETEMHFCRECDNYGAAITGDAYCTFGMGQEFHPTKQVKCAYFLEKEPES